MLKKVLLGCLAAMAVSVSAQTTSFSFQDISKKSNDAALKFKFSGKKLDAAQKTGWISAAQLSKDLTSSPVKVAKAPAAAATTMWYYHAQPSDGRYYVTSPQKLAEFFANNGINQTNTDVSNFAIEVPASFSDAVVDSVINLFYQVEGITSAKLWISNINDDGSVAFGADNADYSMDVTGKLLGLNAQGYLQETKFGLDKKFTVGKNGCMVGYTIASPASSSYYVFSPQDGESGAFILYLETAEQSGLIDVTDYVGCLAAYVHMDVSQCTSSSLAVSSMFETSAKVGADVDLSVIVANEGFQTVNSISYVLNIDGKAQPEANLTLSSSASYNKPIAGNSSARLYLPLGKAQAGEHFVNVTITKVNGEENASGNKTRASSVAVLGLEKTSPVMPVVEEATSTGCGFCPRGTVGMDKLASEMGKNVVILSAHANYLRDYTDPMATSDYNGFMNTFVDGFPTALVNRIGSVDPYAGLEDSYETDSKGNATRIHYGMTSAINYVKNNILVLGEGAVSSFSATQHGKTSVDVTGSVTFNVDRQTNPYSLLYVLTEDGLTGSDAGAVMWSQLNYYCQDYINYYYKQQGSYPSSILFQDDDMSRYVNGAYQVAGEVYNNVVVAAWGDSQNNSLYGCAIEKDEIEKDDAIEFSKTLDISSIPAIQNYDKLKLAVLLINNNTLEIVNAAQVYLGNYEASVKGINNSSNATEVARYNVNGVRMSAPQKGLNIVKMADGTVKKIMVK